MLCNKKLILFLLSTLTPIILFAPQKRQGKNPDKATQDKEKQERDWIERRTFLLRARIPDPTLSPLVALENLLIEAFLHDQHNSWIYKAKGNTDSRAQEIIKRLFAQAYPFMEAAVFSGEVDPTNLSGETTFKKSALLFTHIKLLPKYPYYLPTLVDPKKAELSGMSPEDVAEINNCLVEMQKYAVEDQTSTLHGSLVTSFKGQQIKISTSFRWYIFAIVLELYFGFVKNSYHQIKKACPKKALKRLSSGKTILQNAIEAGLDQVLYEFSEILNIISGRVDPEIFQRAAIEEILPRLMEQIFFDKGYSPLKTSALIKKVLSPEALGMEA